VVQEIPELLSLKLEVPCILTRHAFMLASPDGSPRLGRFAVFTQGMDASLLGVSLPQLEHSLDTVRVEVV